MRKRKETGSATTSTESEYKEAGEQRSKSGQKEWKDQKGGWGGGGGIEMLAVQIGQVSNQKKKGKVEMACLSSLSGVERGG